LDGQLGILTHCPLALGPSGLLRVDARCNGSPPSGIVPIHDSIEWNRIMRTLIAAAFMGLPLMAAASSVDEFWLHLQSLCGQAFEGRLVEAPEGENGFAGRRLVMHLRECTPERIRIPFVVGEDRSRTWVLTRRGDRLELKHDHRHEDGSHDEVTMYGGTTTNTGTTGAQYFPADQHTRELIEPAFSNVWTMRVEPGETFTYGLWRLGTTRVFRIDFDLAVPVAPPPAPWGWEEEA
jgi:hypothetical protein